jgi:outer membrane protein assembly factor BamB
MTTAMPHARATVLPPQLTLAGDTLYAVQGAVYALDAASGSVLGHFASFTSEPVAVGDAIYINTNYIEELALQALDPLTGVARWRYDISDRLSGAPVVTERAILVGVAEGFVDAVDPGDGARLWRHAVGGLVFALPTVAEGVAYCAPAVNPPGQPTVFALRIDNGALLWRAAIPRSTTLPLIVSGGTVYIGAHDGCGSIQVVVSTGRAPCAKSAWSVASSGAPCLARLESTPRMQQNARAPAGLRKQPEIFCWTLSMRRSDSA